MQPGLRITDMVEWWNILAKMNYRVSLKYLLYFGYFIKIIFLMAP